ncbi:hypothetical protein GYH30_050272 [Glycine max]|uniref:Uncharacterized protein n=1 Tax=Glycine max TaxID=3847 RepID=A0A0R0F9B8_SOYBN|nr:hypothetical protein GYH30_050272 [Glycine max]
MHLLFACLAGSSYGMGDLLGHFLESMLVRTKHTEKSCVSLWGQSLILKAGRADYRGLGKGYLWKVLTSEGF